MKAALHSLGAPCGFVNQRVAERQALAIELDKLFATDVVRQRNLDRLIDAARTVRQCILKLLRPVGREHEQDIGILFQSVHLVE